VFRNVPRAPRLQSVAAFADTSSVLNARQLIGDDFASWGLTPVYQVDFWRHQAHKLPDTPPEKVGYEKEAYELTGAADIDEVTSWAREHADGRIVVVHAVLPDSGRGRGLIHLSGADPTITS
jgi:hypothetical protein